MKAVLISIQPQWCEIISRGKKTLEIRKTMPKLETPFKCYIYCTKAPKGWFWFDSPDIRRDGAVIGEFTCDSIKRFDVPYPAYQNELDTEIMETSCCNYYQLHRYAYHDDLYGWHISDLIIYGKPKKLSEFYTWKKCNSCKKSGYEVSACIYDDDCKVPEIVTRAPQSWCYVEEV